MEKLHGELIMYIIMAYCCMKIRKMHFLSYDDNKIKERFIIYIVE